MSEHFRQKRLYFVESNSNILFEAQLNSVHDQTAFIALFALALLLYFFYSRRTLVFIW